MNIKPILFNTEMVRAILDGKKTCTRRIVKGFIPNDAQFGYTGFTPNGAISCRGMFEANGRPGYGEKFFKLPYQHGDILYVRETWHKYTKRVGAGENCHLEKIYGYKASIKNAEDADEPWKPSIHMPREAALEEWKILWNSTIKKSDFDCYGWNTNPWVWVIEFKRCENLQKISF